jgi:hypothetical protein
MRSAEPFPEKKLCWAHLPDHIIPEKADKIQTGKPFLRLPCGFLSK